MKTRILPALLFSALAAPAFGGDDDLKAEAPMTRPPGAPDADAKGKIKAEHDLDKNRHKLSIEAEYIDTSLTFEAWIADAGGAMQQAGVMPYNKPNEVEIEFDTNDGPPLPLGASSVQTLAGRTVEVRVGGQIYLTGKVPSLDGSGGGGGGGSGSGGGADGWIKMKQFLVRADASPDGDVKGYIELRYRTKDNDQKFKVEAEHIDPSTGFAVYLETSVGSGVMQNVGAMGFEDADEVELEIETEDGASLPFGVGHVGDLAGRRVEVRDGSNATYLFGIVPDIGGSTKNTTAQTQLSGTSIGKATLRVDDKAKKGNQSLELNVTKVESSIALELWMFDPSQTAFVKVSDLPAKKNGSARYKVVTKKGEPLPLGAPSLEQIAGLSLEVRQPDGTVRFTGAVPQL